MWLIMADKIELSIIIPAHNEEGCIERAVSDTFMIFKKTKINFEIILVDDGCTDNTLKICEKLHERFDFSLIHFGKKQGYSRALQAGFLRARGRYVTYLDADLQYSPGEILKLYRKVVSNKLDFVIGRTYDKGYSLIRKTVSRTYNLLVKMLFKVPVQDVHCKRVFRRDLLSCKKRGSESLYGLIDLELLLLAIKGGARIKQVPIRVSPRFAGRSKLTLKLMIITLINLFRLRFRMALR